MQARLGELSFRGSVLYTSADFYCAPYCQHNDGRYAEARVVSKLGPIVTWSEEQMEHACGGPSYHQEAWTTWDLRGGEASLTDVVEESSLVNAVQHDPYVLRSLAHCRGKLAAATMRKALRALLRQQIDREGFDQFGFADLQPDQKRVALRLGFHGPYVGMSPNGVKTLGLWVTLRPEFRRLIRNDHPVLVDQEPVRL